jgi:hypothetical protein
MTLFNSNTLFCSLMTPGNSPEILFYRIKKCQEIQQIRKVPYSNNQIIATAVRILVMSNMFPLKEFEVWELMANKMYPALKTSSTKLKEDASLHWSSVAHEGKMDMQAKQFTSWKAMTTLT